MAFKIVLAVALLAVASAVPVHVQQHEAPAHYEFSYAVNDEHTGDIKSQQESRQGDSVQGRYELIDSDGFKRIVEYTADEHTGFNAVVHREPTHIKIPLPAPVQHYSHAAPAHVAHYAAPAVHHQYSAPAPVVQKHITYAPAPVLQHVQHATVAPVVVAKPVVHQYVQHQQPAYVQHQQPAYVQHQQPAYVQHYAPTAAPSVVHSSHQFNHEANHVTFNAPGVNYNF